MYTFIGEVLLRKVKELVIHFVVTCYDKSSVSTDIRCCIFLRLGCVTL